MGQKYLDRISVEQEKFDAIVEDLEQEWRDEAVNYQIIWRRKIKLRN